MGLPKILVVDDDQDMCLLLTRFLTKHGYEVASATTGKNALTWIKNNNPQLILCDYRLDDMTGVEFLSKTKQLHPVVPVIVITGYSDVKDAVEVMKLGAFDYVTKPLFPDEILLTIKKAIASAPSNLGGMDTNNYSQITSKTDQTNSYEYIIGDTPGFIAIMKQIELVAPTNYSVIIYGESGSGKEVVAQQIHQKSNRAEKPFVAIDCGALSKELAASELFGHEKGAFTGALTLKIGSLELANGGTVFLDEIGNLSYDVQISLLRVLQERKIRRVGGVKDIGLNVRIIVASNENLWESARSGKFREDLYHRFNEFSIEVPSLRQRINDIMLFAHHFLKLTNAELGKNVKGFTMEVEDIFRNYVWYGNLRELKNVVKRATLLTDGEYIDAKTLPFEINNFNKLQFEQPVKKETINTPPSNQDITYDYGDKLRYANIEAEREVILDAIKKSNYNKSKAAELLNIDRKTLYNKLKQFKEHNQK